MFKSTPTTVDGVLSAFRTAIDDLNTVANAQRTKADKAQEAIDAATTAKASAEAEAERALKVAAQMQAVFN